MSIPKIRIESDFTDYYDHLNCLDGKHIGIYSRFKSEMPNKSKGLAILKALGIQTVETGAVRTLISDSGKLVVYTNQSDHSGEGRALMRIEEAKLLYPNSLASVYFPEACGVTNKLLQVGSRRFRVLLSDITGGIQKGKVVQIDEITSAYNFAVGLPIFSIDYISTNKGLLAITLNTVERLSDYGFENIMKPEEVINEIFLSLTQYNKLWEERFYAEKFWNTF